MLNTLDSDPCQEIYAGLIFPDCYQSCDKSDQHHQSLSFGKIVGIVILILCYDDIVGVFFGRFYAI